MMFYTESVASIIYNMKNVMSVDHDSKTFARNLVLERENPQLLNQSEWSNNICTNAMCWITLMSYMLYTNKFIIIIK